MTTPSHTWPQIWQPIVGTLKLIELWRDGIIQAQLEECKCKCNKEVYERISRQMAHVGHERTAEQCREKAKKLKAAYRKIKDSHNVNGRGRKNCRFLEAMDGVLADKPSTRPAVLIDTLEEKILQNSKNPQIHSTVVLH